MLPRLIQRNPAYTYSPWRSGQLLNSPRGRIRISQCGICGKRNRTENNYPPSIWIPTVIIITRMIRKWSRNILHETNVLRKAKKLHILAFFCIALIDGNISFCLEENNCIKYSSLVYSINRVSMEDSNRKVLLD